MGRRTLRRSLLALVAMVLPLASCNLSMLTIRIPDFDSAEVLGIRMWHLDPGTGTYTPHGEILVSEPYVFQGNEILKYELVYEDGSRVTAGLTSRVRRNAANPDDVVVRVMPPLSDLGTFRLTTFNSAGDSPLSLETEVF